MTHPIIVGVFGCARYFHPVVWEPKGLPLGEIGANQLVHAHSRSSPSKGGNSRQRPPNSQMPISGLRIDLDHLGNEATPYFTLMATSESFFFFLFMSGSISTLYYVRSIMCLDWHLCGRTQVSHWCFKKNESTTFNQAYVMFKNPSIFSMHGSNPN